MATTVEVFRAPGFSVDTTPEAVTIEFAVPATNVRGLSIRLLRKGELLDFLTRLRTSYDNGPTTWKEDITITCDGRSYYFMHACDTEVAAYAFTVIVAVDLVYALMRQLHLVEGNS